MPLKLDQNWQHCIAQKHLPSHAHQQRFGKHHQQQKHNFTVTITLLAKITLPKKKLKNSHFSRSATQSDTVLRLPEPYRTSTHTHTLVQTHTDTHLNSHPVSSFSGAVAENPPPPCCVPWSVSGLQLFCSSSSSGRPLFSSSFSANLRRFLLLFIWQLLFSSRFQHIFSPIKRGAFGLGSGHSRDP